MDFNNPKQVFSLVVVVLLVINMILLGTGAIDILKFWLIFVILAGFSFPIWRKKKEK